MRQAAQHAPHSTIAGTQYEKEKSSHAPESAVSRRLAKFIHTFHPDESIAMEHYRSFLFTLYDNVFSGITFHGIVVTQDTEDARFFTYQLLLKAISGTADDKIDTYARVVADDLSDMYGSGKDGALDVKYHNVYTALMRPFFFSWGRHEIHYYSNEITELLNCFEYPKGVE